MGGVGGLIVGAGLAGNVADGMAGGASAAFSVTRTVSFFNGTLDVCLDGVLFSFSLMRFGFSLSRKIKRDRPTHVKPASSESHGNFKKDQAKILSHIQKSPAKAIRMEPPN